MLKVTKTNENVVSMKKTMEYSLTLENAKGEEMEVTLQTYYADSEDGGYDNDEYILDESGLEVSNDTLEKFFGEDDYDDGMDLINDSKSWVENDTEQTIKYFYVRAELGDGIPDYCFVIKSDTFENAEKLAKGIIADDYEGEYEGVSERFSVTEVTPEKLLQITLIN